MVANNSTVAAKRTGTQAAKREETRTKILDAALAIIIEDGIRAVRHRAVAKQAGVSLGSTTYHFSSIEDIIISAFQHWRSKALMTESPFFIKTEKLLAPYGGGVVPVSDRARVAAAICEISLAYLRGQLSGKREDRLLELTFYQESLRDEILRELVISEKNTQLEYLISVHRAMGSPQPEEDARITYSLFRQLEQTAILENRSRIDVKRIARALQRHTYLCFGVEVPLAT